MIKGINIIPKRLANGSVRWFVYAWRGGPCIMRQDGGPRPTRLTQEAVEEYHKAIAEQRQHADNTFGRLVQDYRASAAFADLGTKTRYEWGRALDMLPEKWEPVPLEVFEDKRIKSKIVAWRDGLAGKDADGRPKHRRKADYAVGVLRALLAWGRSEGRVGANQAEDVPTLWKGGKRATIIWEPAERETMQGTTRQVRDAFNLACLTGLRRGDLVAVTWAAVGEHAIVWRTSKGEAHERVVTVPMIEPLKALLAELKTRKRAEGVKTILVNSDGKPWTPDGLGASFIKERNKLGLDKHLHDARGTFATELCLAGLTDQEVAGIMGWSPQTVADLRRIYVDQARTVVAIGERLAASTANRSANQPAQTNAK